MDNQFEVQQKNQKSGKGLIAVVIILVLLVLGLGGYIVYDKLLVKDTNKTKLEETTVEETTINETDTINYLDGYYKTGQTYETEEKPCDAVTNPLHGETTEILFKTDGTYVSAYAADCGGGYTWTGKYTVTNNELVLTCDNNDGPCTGTDGKYTINENGIIIDITSPILIVRR